MNTIQINNIVFESTVNGSGIRSVIWVQGCNLRCAGCFNKSLWTTNGGKQLSPEDFVNQLPDGIEGITISGGEPFLQTNLLLFIRRFKELRPDLSIIVFSGFTLTELEKQFTYWSIVLSGIDVLIAGRYEQELKVANDLKGSSNKKYHFFTLRYSRSDMKNNDIEIIITLDEILVTGMIDSKLLNLSM